MGWVEVKGLWEHAGDTVKEAVDGVFAFVVLVENPPKFPNGPEGLEEFAFDANGLASEEASHLEGVACTPPLTCDRGGDCGAVVESEVAGADVTDKLDMPV